MSYCSFLLHQIHLISTQCCSCMKWNYRPIVMKTAFSSQVYIRASVSKYNKVYWSSKTAQDSKLYNIYLARPITVRKYGDACHSSASTYLGDIGFGGGSGNSRYSMYIGISARCSIDRWGTNSSCFRFRFLHRFFQNILNAKETSGGIYWMFSSRSPLQ